MPRDQLDKRVFFDGNRFRAMCTNLTSNRAIVAPNVRLSCQVKQRKSSITPFFGAIFHEVAVGGY